MLQINQRIEVRSFTGLEDVFIQRSSGGRTYGLFIVRSRWCFSFVWIGNKTNLHKLHFIAFIAMKIYAQYISV